MSEQTVDRPDGPNETVRRFLKAIASEGRQQVLMQFTGRDELTVGQVAARLGIGQSTASEQLAALRDARLLLARRDGKTVHYRVDPGGIHTAIAELQAYLLVCCPP